MILRDPHSSKSAKFTVNSQQMADINKYIINDYAYVQGKEKISIKPFEGNDIVLNPVILYGLTDSEKDVTAFVYPIFNTANKWAALDLRAFVNKSEDGYDYTIRNESEYKLSIQRFVLSSQWYVGNTSEMYGLKFAHFAFANWISENIGRKFGLNLGDQLQVKVLATIYYATLFSDNYEPEDIDKLVIRTKDEIAIPSIIKEVFEKIKGGVGGISTIDGFCSACYDVTGNVRLKGLDYAVLVSVLANTWVGANGKDLVLLSLEHPPTWISLVHSSLTMRNFHKTVIATAVTRMDKRGKGQEFLNSLANIVKENIKE